MKNLGREANVVFFFLINCSKSRKQPYYYTVMESTRKRWGEPHNRSPGIRKKYSVVQSSKIAINLKTSPIPIEEWLDSSIFGIYGFCVWLTFWELKITLNVKCLWKFYIIVYKIQVTLPLKYYNTGIKIWEFFCIYA